MSTRVPVSGLPETHDDDVAEFDVQANYVEFLEEARKHARTEEQRNLGLQREQEKGKDSHEGTKNKKLRKKSLLFWKRPSQRKDKTPKVASQSNSPNGVRRNNRSVSGPIYKIAATITPTCGGRRVRSGPIDGNIPYASLQHLNQQHREDLRPIYLVT